jgi:hypothetical protein
MKHFTKQLRLFALRLIGDDSGEESDQARSEIIVLASGVWDTSNDNIVDFIYEKFYGMDKDVDPDEIRKAIIEAKDL